ncbi:MAG: hypothetical protein KDK36_19785 [Leptospiraceae bacterium]|nr:hypothetical protein [Leptospiraceae bacterium]
MFRSRFFICLSLVLLATISRLIPHPANFSPILAIALFSGAHFQNRRDALLVPILAWFISDIFLGFHSLQIVVYALAALMVMAGWLLKDKVSALKIAGSSIGGTIVFFLVTNFFVWATSGMYSFDFAGFINCYAAAIPFFQNSLAGTLVFSTALFGSMYLIEKYGVISKETVTVKA